jgi:hypothetical protein
MNIESFLQQVKQKCEAKAKQMAAVELSVWNDGHESELKQHHGFTNATLKQRQQELIKKIR